MPEPTSSAAIALGPAEVAMAAGLVLIAGGLSMALRLRLERRLLVAAARALVQLLLVGYLLVWIFSVGSPTLVAAAFLIMTLAAARAAVKRPSRWFRGMYPRVLVTLMLTGAATTATATHVILAVEPWYQPRYFLPLLGMVFGNSLTGISLCLDQLLEALDERRGRIEVALALGASSWEASRDVVLGAVRRGMIPIINTMSVAGVVSLPGMMTGQILAGAEPLQAVAYQVVVLFMIAAATALGSILAALLVQRRLFNARHQLLADRIIRRRE